MLPSIIKYFAMILCSLYVYRRLLGMYPQAMSGYVLCCLFSLLLSVFVAVMRLYAAPLSMIFIVALLTAFALWVFKSPFNLSITTSILSLASGYMAFLLASAMLLLPVGCMSKTILIDPALFNVISLLCIGMLQYLLLRIPFRFKRLKNGMPFLQQYGDSDIGVYIATSLLLATSFFTADKGADRTFMIPIAFITICGIILLFWWRSRLTRNYLERTKARELQEMMEEKDARITELEYHNTELSKIVHRDNKLIPAMALAVREYIASPTLDKLKGEALLAQLESTTQERHGILKNYETKGKVLSATRVAGIDALLSYLCQKAAKDRIDFNVSLSGSVKYLIETIISEADLKTLLADLIENACIAVRCCENRNVFLNIAIVDEHYAVDVFDSGVPFAADVLLRLGKQKITTHADTGGSGIGMVTTFELLEKYYASFQLEEFPDNHAFSKKVSVSFDHMGKYCVKTYRRDLMEALSTRDDIYVLPLN